MRFVLHLKSNKNYDDSYFIKMSRIVTMLLKL
jgi:hypothetical protein